MRSAVTISGNKAYTGCFGGNVYALDASNGNIVWTYKTGGDVWSTLMVANGVVYVGSNDFNFYAINSETGSLIWSFPTSGAVWSSPAIANGIVYVGSADDNMYALDASTGAQIWSYPTGGDIRSSPSIANGVIYFSSQDSSLYALDAATGTKIWSATTGDGDTYTNSSPAVVDGVVYIGSTDTNLYAFRASDGTAGWTFKTPSKVSSSPAVHAGVVYVGSESGDFYAINAASGKQVWSYSTEGPIYSSPAIADGVVYVGSYAPDNSVYAFDASSGKLLWSYLTNSGVFSSPTIAGGVMFVGSYDSNVYAFGTKFNPSSTSDQTPTQNQTGYIAGNVWAPPPANGVASSIVTVGMIALTAIVAAALSSVPASAASVSGRIIEKIGGKLRGFLPSSVKDWFESLVLSKHKLKIEEKQGSLYKPTKGELLVYLASILIFSISFAYVQVDSFSEFLVVLPTFVGTSLIVSLVRTYLLTVFARRIGVWTEYKLWYLGIALFVISTVAFHAPFSSPTRRISTSNKPANFGGIVTSVSILISLGFAGIFFALLMAGFTLVGGAGLAMCLIAALIDTIPIKPMFGADIYKYNKLVWATLFLLTLSLYAIWLTQFL